MCGGKCVRAWLHCNVIACLWMRAESLRGWKVQQGPYLDCPYTTLTWRLASTTPTPCKLRGATIVPGRHLPSPCL